MDLLYGWVKNLVCFYILMTAVLHLLPSGSYRKYVRFFGGLLLVILLLSPILEWFRDPDLLLQKVSYESFWQEMDTVRLDVKGMEKVQQQAYKKEYEKAIANDIALMAEESSFTVLSSQAELTEDYRLAWVDLSLLPKDQEGEVLVEKITFSDNSREYPGVLELKQRIMEFYQVKEEQIQIMVQEG